MIGRLINNFNNRWETWVRKRSLPGSQQVIDTRNLYILPTAFGWAYGVLVVMLLIGGINYQNNMIFLLTFMLALIGMVSACEAHGNILNLKIKFIAADDTFAGSETRASILFSADQQSRFGLYAKFKNQRNTHLGHIPIDEATFSIPVTQLTRGYFPLPPLIISSVYPFGIFRVWSYVFFDEHVYVYPLAKETGYWPPPDNNEQGNKSHSVGDDEYYDLKSVETPWADPKLIAWKIAAKGQGWFIKRMHSHEVDYWLFKLSNLTGHDIELKLSHLCYWLQTAEANNKIYALDINDTIIPYSHGKEHLQQCLRQLAVYS